MYSPNGDIISSFELSEKIKKWSEENEHVGSNSSKFSITSVLLSFTVDFVRFGSQKII